MKYYFAPMEGITLYPLRNTHSKFFSHTIDSYYTAFLTAPKTGKFKKREKRDVAVFTENVVPQIMAGSADNFIWAAKEMLSLGYEEINLNLGCPAPTVTNRHKGAGLLTDQSYLDEMLSKIFSEEFLQGKVSVKSRLGFSDETEYPALMEIFSKYPIKELTIHARVRDDFYKGTPRIEAFFDAIKCYKRCGGSAKICYNGDIFDKKDLENILNISGKDEDYKIDAIMLGRGLLQNPALARELKGGSHLNSNELKKYLNTLYTEYEKIIPEERNVIFKLLEHWAFVHVHFRDCEKELKEIRKARSKAEYLAAVNNIFASCEFI